MAPSRLPPTAPFNAADPSTYPERLAIRVPVAWRPVHAHPLVRVLRAGQMAADEKLTMNIGLRYDVDIAPFVSHSIRCSSRASRSTRTTSSRASALPTTWMGGRFSAAASGDTTRSFSSVRSRPSIRMASSANRSSSSFRPAVRRTRVRVRDAFRPTRCSRAARP